MKNLLNLTSIKNIVTPGGGSLLPSLPTAGLLQWLFSEANTSTQAVDKQGTRSGTVFAGRCYDFDGTDDYISHPTVTLSGDFTITINIKLDALTSTRAISYFNSANSIKVLNTGAIRFEVNNNVITSSTGSISATTAHEIIISRTGSSVDVSVDGSSVGTGTESGDFKANLVGYDGSGEYIDGKLFSLQLGGELQYNCEEGDGTTAFDSSGNENHGTITNATLSTFHTTDADVSYSWLNQVGYSNSAYFSGGNTSKIDFGSLGQNLNRIKAKLYLGYDITASSPSTGDILVNLNGNFGGIYFGGWTGSLTNELLSLGTTSGYRVGYTSVSGTIEAGYHEIDIEWNGTGYEINLDGSRVDNTTSGTAVQFTAADLIVGQRKDGLGGYGFNGYISELELYSSSDTLVFKSEFDVNSAGNFTDTAGSLVGTPTSAPQVQTPRDESSTTNDVFGNTLQHSGLVKLNADFVESNCGTFDGSNDSADFTSITLDGAFDIEVSFNADSTASAISPLGDSGNDNVTIGSGGLVRLRIDGTFYDTSLTISAGTDYNIVFSRDASNNLTATNDGESILSSTTATGTLTLSTIGRRNGTVQMFDGKIWNVKITKAGTVEAYFPMSEGAGNKLYDISGNDNHATLANITESSFWGSTQDVYHYNVTNGFEHYDDNATGLDIIRVPYKSDGSQITPTISGYTKNQNNPAGTWHNDAETKLKMAAVAPSLKDAAFWYSSGTPQARSYSDIVANYASGNVTFADVSVDNKKKNLVTYDSAQSGSTLDKIKSFLNIS